MEPTIKQTDLEFRVRQQTYEEKEKLHLYTCEMRTERFQIQRPYYYLPYLLVMLYFLVPFWSVSEGNVLGWGVGVEICGAKQNNQDLMKF